MIRLLWDKTDRCLQVVRRQIANSLETKFVATFDKLRQEVKSLNKIEYTSNLLNCIAKTKSDMNTALEVVSNWFTRSTSTYTQDYPAKLITDVCKATINNMYPNQNFSPEVTVHENMLLKGFTMTSLSSILYILVDNAISYCGFSSIPNISIGISRSEGSLALKVTNELNETIELDVLRRKLESVRSSIGESGSIENVNKEGGTGLHKVAKIIHFDLEAKADLKFWVSDDFKCHIDIEINEGDLFLGRSQELTQLCS